MRNERRKSGTGEGDEEREIFVLRNMKIDGVALVPRGANNRVFVLAKNAGEQPAMKLNRSAKEAAVPAMQGCLDKAMSAYALITGAEVDDSAEDAEGQVAVLFKMLSEESGQYADRFGKKKKPEMDKADGVAAAAAAAAAASVEAASAIDVAKAGRKFSAANLGRLKALRDSNRSAADELDKLISSAEADTDGTAAAASVASPPVVMSSVAAPPVAKSIADQVAEGVQAALTAVFAKAAPPVASTQTQSETTQTRVIAAPTGVEPEGGARNSVRSRSAQNDLFAAPDFGAAVGRLASTSKH